MPAAQGADPVLSCPEALSAVPGQRWSCQPGSSQRQLSGSPPSGPNLPLHVFLPQHPLVREQKDRLSPNANFSSLKARFGSGRGSVSLSGFEREGARGRVREEKPKGSAASGCGCWVLGLGCHGAGPGPTPVQLAGAARTGVEAEWQPLCDPSRPPARPRPGLVQRLPGDIAGEGVASGHAAGLPREGRPPPSVPPQGTQAGQRGQEDLAEVGGDEVVQHGVDGGADVEEGVGQHVEVVVEVIQEPGVGEDAQAGGPDTARTGQPVADAGAWGSHCRLLGHLLKWGYFTINSRAMVSLERLEVLSTLPPGTGQLNCRAELQPPTRGQLCSPPWPQSPPLPAAQLACPFLCRIPAPAQGCRTWPGPGLNGTARPGTPSAPPRQLCTSSRLACLRAQGSHPLIWQLTSLPGGPEFQNPFTLGCVPRPVPSLHPF